MAIQFTKTTKILLIVLVIVIIVGIILLILIPRLINKNTNIKSAVTNTSISKVENTGSNNLKNLNSNNLNQEEEYKKLIENKDFVNVFNNFEYPNSEIKEVRLVEEDGSMFYLVLNTTDDFKKVDDFYKTKEVQSTWSKSNIFETSSSNIEELFLSSNNSSSESTISNDTENNNYSKYSYFNENKDKLLNVLLKSSNKDFTQIMIIFWKLSN